jgi:hypothetical protein
MIDAIKHHEEEMAVLRVKQLESQREALGYIVLYYWRRYKWGDHHQYELEEKLDRANVINTILTMLADARKKFS